MKDIEPIRLLDQYSQTKWFKYRFGGGIPKRPKPEKPLVVIEDEESRLEYIRQLMTVYKEYTNGRLKSKDEIYRSVIDICTKEYSNSLDRVNNNE